jgi:hypothetical protein
MSDRRTLLTAAALLLRRMDELTDEVIYHERPLDEIRIESLRVQNRWREIMDELYHHAPDHAMPNGDKDDSASRVPA